MRKEFVEIHLYEKGDYITTSTGLGMVIYDEVFNAYERSIEVEWIYSIFETDIGSVDWISSEACSLYDKDISEFNLEEL